MRYPRGAKIFRGQVDVAPYLGVLFLLVIFLVMRFYLVHPSGIKILLPEGGVGSGVTGPKLIVGIDSAGRLFFENQMLDEQQLRVRLASRIQESEKAPTLLIQADAKVPNERIVQLSALAQDLGITQAALETRPNTFLLPRSPKKP